MKARYFSSTSTLIFAFCLAAISLPRAQAPAAAPPPPPSVKSGQTAPDFAANYFMTVDGKRQNKAVKLSDYKGQKNVVLAFFPAAFSPGCTSEMAKYQENTGEFNKNNTVTLGLSVDSVWANQAFAEKLGVQFPMLSDSKRDISRTYGVFDEQGSVARRTTFVIDRKGVVQKVFMAQEALDPNSALEACALLKEVK